MPSRCPADRVREDHHDRLDERGERDGFCRRRARHFPQADREQRGTLLDTCRPHVQTSQHALRQRVGRGQGGAIAFEQPVEHLAQRRDVERLLVGEVMNERGTADADALGDILHPRTGKAALGEHLLRREEDGATRLFASRRAPYPVRSTTLARTRIPNRHDVNPAG
jgi:hypothetical protein